MPEPRRSGAAPVLALAAYAALVAVPLLVLFGRVVLDRRAAPAPATVLPAAGPAAAPGTTAPQEGEGLPPFETYTPQDAPPFPDLLLAPVAAGAAPTRLSALLHGTTLVHLWSLGCSSCSDEWPAFHAFAAAAAGRPGFPAVLPVLVAQDAGGDVGAAARAALDKVHSAGWFDKPAPDVNADWAVAEEAVLSPSEPPTAQRPITGYPETFVLDGQGRTRLRLVGPLDWDADTWPRLLALVPDLAPPGTTAGLPPGHPPLPAGSPTPAP